MKLLADITANIKEPAYTFGRPTLPIRDLVYSSIMKVYSTFSLRRFMGDIETAFEKEYVTTKPCYASIGHFMQREDITKLLTRMVIITSLPLKTVETRFAIDSTGFSTSKFDRWFSFKHGKEMDYRKWVKCHFMCGVKTNIITGVKITSEFSNDSPELPDLLAVTKENFNMEEVSADKAYSSRENHNLINEAGAVPYIPFRSNAKGNSAGSQTWKKMYFYFKMNQDEFMQHYHSRSNVEATVFMVKSKFGDYVRSKEWTSQVNEVLCKIICHNICCVIQEMYELGIKAEFNLR